MPYRAVGTGSSAGAPCPAGGTVIGTAATYQLALLPACIVEVLDLGGQRGPVQALGDAPGVLVREQEDERRLLADQRLHLLQVGCVGRGASRVAGRGDRRV